MKKILLFVLLSAFPVTRAWCQNPNTPWLPVGLNGETGSLGFSGTSAESQFAVGLAASALYDDNVLSNNADKVGSFGYTITPNIAITEVRPRLSLAASYLGGYTQYQQQGSVFTQDLFLSMQYRLTEKLSLQLGDTFIRMDTSSRGLYDNSSTPNDNPLEQPNNVIITPDALTTTNSSRVGLVYQPSQSTVMQVGGTFSIRNFADIVSGTNEALFDSKSGSANASYQHRILGSKSWLGASYIFQRILTSGQVTEAANTQTVQVSYTFAPTSNLSLSLFAGPDWLKTQDNIVLTLFGTQIPLHVPSSSLGVNAGGTFGWRGQRTSAGATFFRRVSDGGGLTGAVHGNNGTADFRRQLNEHWTAHVGLIYGQNDAVSILYGNSFRTISAQAGLQWTLRQNLNFSMTYARDQQRTSVLASALQTATPGSNTVDHDRAWVTVSYQFTRPLGR
jgi:hypothetical protein